MQSSRSSRPLQSTDPQFTVFLSHADEDKATIAVPLREKLHEEGIHAFLDEKDMPPGAEREQAMVDAMETAQIAVIVLSPEFVARKWPMKALMCFLRRREKCMGKGQEPPEIIPFFYRLRISDLYDEPRLDRLDKDGNQLHNLSRFRDRQKNGEPEASIGDIKLALKSVHGIMGVRNDVDATNDSSYLMSKRRNEVLKEVCKAVCDAADRIETRASMQKSGNARLDKSFNAHFDHSNDVSYLVFAFNRLGEHGKRCSQEGQVLDMLLDRQLQKNETIAVWGMAGVGKTSFLEGIRKLEVVRRRFRDGVYKLSMGKDTTCAAMTKELSMAVKKSGGAQSARKMMTERNIGEVMQEFRSWFKLRDCLFMIDDVWETEQMSAGVIDELFKLHMSGRDSKVLVTTRSPEIAAKAESPFGLRVREPLQEESRAILYRYSGLEPGVPREEHQDDNRMVDSILERCGGLPLFLAVAGRAVKSLKQRSRHSGCLAYHLYAEKVKSSMENMVDRNIDSYDGLRARLMISVKLLEERRSLFGFRVKLGVAELHRRLSVVKKQSRVPMNTLMKLWEVEDRREAAILAKEFEQVGLAGMEIEKQECGVVEMLRLHDSVHDFAVHESRAWDEESVGHEILVRGYGDKLQKTWNGCREWWGRSVELDGYIHINLCRHLVGAGCRKEVWELLLTPEWAQRQLKVSGMVFLVGDFATGINAVREGTQREDGQECKELEEALTLIMESLNLSSGFVGRNARELWFQMHGRLHGCRRRNRVIGKYVKWMETKATRPLVLSENRFLVEPGGQNTRIVSVGVLMYSMTMLPDGDRVVCGCVDGRIAVVNVRHSKMERIFKSHDERTMVLRSMAFARDGARVISVTWFGEVTVWDEQSRRSLKILRQNAPRDGIGAKCVAITHDGKRAAFGCVDGTFQVWDADTGLSVTGPIESHTRDVTCMEFFGDGGKIVTGGKDGKLRVWNTATGVEVGAFEGHFDAVTGLTISRDDRHVLSGAEDGTVRLWDVESLEQIQQKRKEGSGRISCVGVSSNGNRVIYGAEDYKIRVWDVNSGTDVCAPLTGHSQEVTGVAFLADDDSIVSCSEDGTVRVWDLTRTGTENAIEGHTDVVSDVRFTQDGKHVVSGSYDRTIRIWDARTGAPIGDALRGHNVSVSGVAVTPDGRYIVSVSWDETVRVWDFRKRSLLHTFTGRTGRIDSIAISPNGDYALTGSSDKTLRLWDLRTMDGSHVVLEGHSKHVKRVFVSDDGLRIISIEESGISIFIVVCDIKTKRIIRRVKPETDWRSLMNATRESILERAGEPAVRNPMEFNLILAKQYVILRGEPGPTVLATLEEDISRSDLSPDGKTICLGLKSGKVAFLKLCLEADDCECVIS